MKALLTISFVMVVIFVGCWLFDADDWGEL